MATSADRIRRVRENYERILLMLTEDLVDSQTQADIDAVVTAAGSAGIPTPRMTHSVDGKSYDLTGYQTFLIDKIAALQKLEQVLTGPFEIRSRGCT